MQNVWDDKGAIDSMDKTALFGKIHRAIYQMNREPFLSRAGDMVAANTEAAVFSLVSPSVSAQNWQQGANIHWSLSHDCDAEVSFFPLIPHFVADMVLPAIFGTAFMRNYPNCESDLFAFDDNFNLFLMGLPSWTSGMRKSAAARTRLKAGLADLHAALVASSRGEAPPGGYDGRWADLSDVSSVAIARVSLWEEAGAPAEAYVAGHALLVWVTLINANVIIFWLLFQIYRDPRLLKDIRQELLPVTTVEKSTNPNEMPKLKLDSRGIQKETPLLQSTFLETMRLYTTATLSKTLMRISLSLNRGQERISATGAEILHPRSSNFRPVLPGNTNCTKDDATNFNTRRFLVPEQSLDSNKGSDITKPGAQWSAAYTRIMSWGAGASMCPGQKFSQREVLEITAAIVKCWDVKPIDSEIGWSHPGLKTAGGTAVPKDNVRVKLRRILP